MTALDASGAPFHWSRCSATRYSQCWARNCPYMVGAKFNQSGQIVGVVCALEGNVWVSGTDVQWFEDFAG